jgi:uncharacterized protein (DUF1684 family)
VSADLEAWKAARRAALAAVDGWLNLTDRIDLAFGAHSVGSAEGNSIRLSTGPAHLGELTIDENDAFFAIAGGQPQPFVLAAGGFPQLTVSPLLLEIHDAGGQPALRVRDLTIRRDVAIRYFPADPDWIIAAKWEPLPAPQDISIGQKGGTETSVTLTHRATFTHEGHMVSLMPTHWKGGKPMFVIRDKTSGRETYAASRFLIGEDVTDTTITLDFNRAHNPPCAFTEFAICPLPPR